MKKLDAAFIKAQFELSGYKMLSDYVNNRTPIKFECTKGHHRQISWTDFNKGHRCRECAGNLPLVSGFVNAAFANEGYELLEPYQNSVTPIKFRCPQGHTHKMRWHDFKKGVRCRLCLKLSSKSVSKILSAEGYQLLGDFKGSQELFEFCCPRGHIHKMKWANFQQGSRCGICVGFNKSTESVKSIFALEGYELLDEYRGANFKLNVRCSKGHDIKITLSKFQQGRRCGACYSEQFYNKAGGRAFSRITTVLAQEVKRQGLEQHWTDWYSSDVVSSISAKIEEVYQTCLPGWTVDHIIPVSWFDLAQEGDLLACWSPENLRHLPASKNFSRGNRATAEEVAMMNQLHPHIVLAASRYQSKLQAYVYS